MVFLSGAVMRHVTINVLTYMCVHMFIFMCVHLFMKNVCMQMTKVYLGCNSVIVSLCFFTQEFSFAAPSRPDCLTGNFQEIQLYLPPQSQAYKHMPLS